MALLTTDISEDQEPDFREGFVDYFMPTEAEADCSVTEQGEPLALEDSTLLDWSTLPSLYRVGERPLYQYPVKKIAAAIVGAIGFWPSTLRNIDYSNSYSPSTLVYCQNRRLRFLSLSEARQVANSIRIEAEDRRVRFYDAEARRQQALDAFYDL